MVHRMSKQPALFPTVDRMIDRKDVFRTCLTTFVSPEGLNPASQGASPQSVGSSVPWRCVTSASPASPSTMVSSVAWKRTSLLKGAMFGDDHCVLALSFVRAHGRTAVMSFSSRGRGE